MQTRTRPYEILVRLNSDGTSAAHQKDITEVLSDDGTSVLMAQVGLPTDIDATQAAAAMGAAAAQIAVSLSQANSQRDAMQATVTTQAAQIDQLNIDKRTLTASLNTVTTAWQEAQTQLAAKST